jgi:hypothetical protein
VKGPPQSKAGGAPQDEDRGAASARAETICGRLSEKTLELRRKPGSILAGMTEEENLVQALIKGQLPRLPNHAGPATESWPTRRGESLVPRSMAASSAGAVRRADARAARRAADRPQLLFGRHPRRADGGGLGARAAVGRRLALRYFQDEGEWPRSIAISAWGTSNMRTGGDDIAQVLALIGAKPVWESGTGRITGFEVLPLASLAGRAST